jgi:hypothetical protein
MRVQILKLGAGPAGVRTVGQVVEVGEDEGRALVADKAARALPPVAAAPTPPPPSVETAAEAEEALEEATAPPAPERAVTRHKPKGRRR